MTSLRLSLLFCLFASTATQVLFAQQPAYTKKRFVSQLDTTEFKTERSTESGFRRYYIVTEPEIWDTDDENTTHVRGGGGSAVLCIEGTFRDDKKEGDFLFFLIDSADHSKRYKLWEQAYSKDMLNGEWKTYNLRGNVVMVQNFTNDSLKGSSKQFWIDGVTLMEERVYENGQNEYVYRSYYKSGKIHTEQSFRNGVVDGFSKDYYENGVLKEHLTVVKGVPNGAAKRFYENGTMMEDVFLLDGKLHGVRKYYYPTGKIWIEQEYKNGLPWNILGNYDRNGKRRNAGTLRKGNGTVLLYNDDGSLRETITYVNGQKT